MSLDTLPDAHGVGAVPSVINQDNDVIPPEQQPAYLPREARSWRAVSYGQAPGPATDTYGSADIAPHTNAGRPDPRAVWGGQAGRATAGAQFDNRPEQITNVRELENVHAQAPIDRPRAGSVGTDATRPAAMPRWLFSAPFDQWAQYGPSAHPKIEQPSPLASRPLQFDAALAGGIPSPGGSGATTVAGFDGPQTNTVRYLPAPSDAGLVVANTDVSVGYESHARSRGWGLR